MVRWENFEPEMTAHLLSKFKVDTVFLDVGANVGYYTLLAAPLVERVVAFEPNPVFRRWLEQEIAKAKFENVAVCPVGLFSKAAKGVMDPKRHKSIIHLDQYGEHKVEMVTLDSLSLAPTLMKVDVEGAELDVLLGAEETLLAYRPDLAIEVHRRRIEKYFGRKADQVTEFLEDLGYAVSFLKLDGGHVRAEWKGKSRRP